MRARPDSTWMLPCWFVFFLAIVLWWEFLFLCVWNVLQQQQTHGGLFCSASKADLLSALLLSICIHIHGCEYFPFSSSSSDWWHAFLSAAVCFNTIYTRFDIAGWIKEIQGSSDLWFICSLKAQREINPQVCSTGCLFFFCFLMNLSYILWCVMVFKALKLMRNEGDWSTRVKTIMFTNMFSLLWKTTLILVPCCSCAVIVLSKKVRCVCVCALDNQPRWNVH